MYKPLDIKKYRAVLFDLDGTLTDSMNLWIDIDREYLADVPGPMPETMHKDIEGMSFGETAQYFQSHFFPDRSLERIMDDWNRMAYEKYRYQVHLKPGAEAFIRKLHEKNIPMAICTCNSLPLVQAVLERHPVLRYMDCILTGEDIAAGKPAPDGYLLAAEKLGVRPQDCLVFEDIPNGILAGKNAGMDVIAMEDSFSGHQRESILALADGYITDYAQLAI